MYLLRIEHAVPSFEAWKQAFDSDPVGRRRSGVRRYRVYRPVDDPGYAMVDLEFDTAAQAEGLLTELRTMWGRVEGTVMREPKARVVEVVEDRAL